MAHRFEPLLQPHDRLGDFEVLRFLGRGGMGEVYEALQPQPRRHVALKVLAAWLCDSADALDRFRREADVLARLDDQRGIVQVYTAGRTPEGTAYYVMRLIRGPSLAKLLRDARKVQPAPERPSTLPWEMTAAQPHHPRQEVVVTGEDTPARLLRAYKEDRYGFTRRVGAQAARALQAAHSRGVLHRDLKASNLMIEDNEQVYLVDFGLARLLDAKDGSALGGCGTPWYMSPEQAAGRPLDERSDLFSLGVTLYELATGGAGPYDVPRGDQDAVLRTVEGGRLLPLRQFAADVPPELEAIVSKATCSAVEQRCRSASEMLADLENAGTNPPVRQPAVPSLASTTPQPRRWHARAVAGAFLLVALLAAGVAAWWPSGTPPQPERSQEKTPPFPWVDNPLPEVRQFRRFGEPIALFKKERLEPIWCQRLRGDPNWKRPQPDALMMSSFTPFPTYVLLDYDAGRNWYLFDIKLQQPRGKMPDAKKCEGGLFFGYRRVAGNPGHFYPCFVVQLVENVAAGEDPHLLIGSLYFEEDLADRALMFRTLAPFTGVPDRIKLPPLQPGEPAWRRIRIRALDDRVTILVDGGQPLELHLANLRTEFHQRQEGEIDPRAGVGIWVHQGIGFFADATVTPLASER